MCELECGCLVCMLESNPNHISFGWDEEQYCDETADKLKQLDLFDEFVKAGLGS